MAINWKFDGTAFIYNPENILRIQPLTVVDRIEYLITKKRYLFSKY